MDNLQNETMLWVRNPYIYCYINSIKTYLTKLITENTGDGELGILRKPGAKSENQVEPEFNRILGKNQVVTYEDTHLALKGFHIC